MNYPIKLGKRPNQKEFMADKREQELKSILKRTAVPTA